MESLRKYISQLKILVDSMAKFVQDLWLCFDFDPSELNWAANYHKRNFIGFNGEFWSRFLLRDRLCDINWVTITKSQQENLLYSMAIEIWSRYLLRLPANSIEQQTIITERFTGFDGEFYDVRCFSIDSQRIQLSS